MPYAIKDKSWRAINSENDLADGETFSLVAPPSTPEPSAIVTNFPVPITAPDFIVMTPKINDDPELALDEAIAEMEKGEVNTKSIALIALSLAKYLKSKKNKLK